MHWRARLGGGMSRTVALLVAAGSGTRAGGEPGPREALLRVQTPQACRFGSILAAHRAWSGGEATDDAQIGRAAGLRVTIVQGDPALDKFTYVPDFRRVEAMLLTPRV